MNASSSQSGDPILQNLWDYVRSEHKDVLLSPYLPACSAFMLHVMFCTPFLVLDVLAGVSQRIRSWRISAQPPSPVCQWLECLWRIVVRYLTAVLPATALLQTLRNPPVLPYHAPSCWQLFVEVFACFLLFDTFFFVWHLCMHR
uniref:cholesterol 25-hydroxylase-like protein 1, member 1 n=1 Tax=Doryrhamphus excisus TaxID=161450 RepID=UPI0025ADB3CA|nr:cholesterol 25-hydroxylase-like protein 1, member 1 [Doryrhamphus excisus]